MTRAVDPMVSRHVRWTVGSVLAVLMLLALGGCSKNPAKPQETTGQFAWSGRYEGQNGSLVIDVHVVDTSVSGEIVFTDPSDPHYHLVGVVAGDSLRLAVDPTYPASTFTLRARVSGDSLTGTMAGGPLTAPVAFRGHALPRMVVIDDRVHDVPYGAVTIAYDGTWIWVSTATTDYLRFGTDGSFHDMVSVLYRGYHWVSSTLAWDGQKMWGTYPGTYGPPVSIDYSELLAFDANGRAPDSLRLWQRSEGLAWDGTHLRTLKDSWIKRIDGTGAILDSIAIDVPDPVHLEWDGSTFWTLGWYMKRLYHVSAQGELLAICDLPGQDTGSFPAGIAVEGPYLWYAESPIGTTQLHRLTLGPAAPVARRTAQRSVW